MSDLTQILKCESMPFLRQTRVFMEKFYLHGLPIDYCGTKIAMVNYLHKIFTTLRPSDTLSFYHEIKNIVIWFKNNNFKLLMTTDPIDIFIKFEVDRTNDEYLKLTSRNNHINIKRSYIESVSNHVSTPTRTTRTTPTIRTIEEELRNIIIDNWVSINYDEPQPQSDIIFIDSSEPFPWINFTREPPISTTPRRRRRGQINRRKINDSLSQLTDEEASIPEFECKVCYTNKKCVAITKCGHTFCKSCVLRCDNCATCRVPYTETDLLRIYI